MKGTLNKHEEGWLVRYGDMQFIPLHPDFIEMMDTCFTSKFTQVVDFEMVLCSHSKSKDDYYAKLIHHSVESNEMIEDTFKVWECCGMEECICKESVEKLAETEYPIFDGDLLSITHNQKHSRIDFIKGYNKAKETLYTEEQVREAIEMARGIKDDEMTFDISSIIGCGEVCTYGWKEEYTNEEIIQSLKQPKQ
jgi:hypothetical protein